MKSVLTSQYTISTLVVVDFALSVDHLKPIVPGILNLANGICRWTALEMIDASLLVMLIGGMDLILSVLAAKYIRGRGVTTFRWVAVGILVVGVTLVAWAGLSKDIALDKEHEAEEAKNGEVSLEEESSEEEVSAKSQAIGFILVLAQCVLAVIQNLSEEVFTQDGDFPALLLLGLEGMYGALFGLIIYVPLANNRKLEETFDEGTFRETWSILLNDRKLGWFTLFLCLLVSITGVFNIYSVAETSAMTRNLWKNTRAILVWFVGVIAFYGSNDPELPIGEELHEVYSPFQAIGFMIMCLGIYIYYNDDRNVIGEWWEAICGRGEEDDEEGGVSGDEEEIVFATQLNDIDQSGRGSNVDRSLREEIKTAENGDVSSPDQSPIFVRPVLAAGKGKSFGRGLSSDRTLNDDGTLSDSNLEVRGPDISRGASTQPPQH